MMTLRKLIDDLSMIESRLAGKPVEVEIRDSEGFPTTDFHVQTEIMFTNERITVRFVPNEDGDA